jgi:SAM-dependent methyltransferase
VSVGAGWYERRVMGKRKRRFTAKTADRHELYQLSVQAPDHEVALLGRMFKRHTGRRAISLREDFCGTALLCASWVQSKPDRIATGLDIDGPTLAWGRERNIAPLGPDAERVTLLEQNVLVPPSTKFDVVCAFNYSFQTFQTRELLLRYFRAVHRSLLPEGLFVLDLLGGWESQQVLVEKRALDGFTYVWEQAEFDPIRNHFLAYIHFELDDGTKLKRAFTYDWRLWTIVELRELLAEAGFVEVDVYWEGDDGEGGGNGEFSRVDTIHNDPGWNTYLVAKKRPPLPGSKDAARAEKKARKAAREE